MIERNTTIPTRKSEVFTTAADNQPSVEVHVLQGERDFAKDNRTLGRFILDGIPPAMRGIPKIEVAFDIDANGILNVSAKDLASGKEHKIRIEASSGLGQEEIDKMVKEAKDNAAEDRKRREIIDAKNAADGLIYQTDKNLTEYGSKIGAEAKQKIEAALNRLKEAVKTDNVNEIRSASDALNQTWNEVSATLYQQPGGGEAGTDAQSGAKTGDNVEEADFEVVDDDNSAKDNK